MVVKCRWTSAFISNVRAKYWEYIIFDSGNARIVFERAIEYYGDDNMDQYLYIAFARFEESQREVGCMCCFARFGTIYTI